MPCHDDHTDQTLSRLQLATRAACELRRALRDGKAEHELSEETRRWIREHDEMDARHAAEEAKRARTNSIGEVARRKLTNSELRALRLWRWVDPSGDHDPRPDSELRAAAMAKLTKEEVSALFTA